MKEYMRSLATREAAGQFVKVGVIGVFNTVVDGIITINERGIIDSFNPSAERMFNYTAREVIGKSVSILMPAPFSYEHDEYIRHYLRTGRARVHQGGPLARHEVDGGDALPAPEAGVDDGDVGRVLLHGSIVA